MDKEVNNHKSDNMIKTLDIDNGGKTEELKEEDRTMDMTADKNGMVDEPKIDDGPVKNSPDTRPKMSHRQQIFASCTICISALTSVSCIFISL